MTLPQKKEHLYQRSEQKAGDCASGNGVEPAALGVGKKMAEQVQGGDNAPLQELADRADAHAGMTSDGYLTAYATAGNRVLMRI